MQGFINFYSWGVTMKFHMGIYSVALIFFNGIVRWLMGERTIPILTLAEMILTAALVAMAESCIFPRYQEWEGRALTRRTVLWALVCNLGFLGGAAVFRWFRGIPFWGAAVLGLVLEAGIFAMWFATHVALRKDSKWLNYKLKQYQER